MDKMRSIYRNTGYLLFLLVIITFICPASTWADQNIHLNVKTILASGKKNFIDPRLKNLVSELKSVFRYSSYEFLNQKGLNLSTNKKGVVSLPEGRAMNIYAKGVEGNRVVLEIEITKNNNRIFQTVIKLRKNSSITIGGPRYKEGGNLLFNIFASF